MELFFISDTHFFHANILKFTGDDGKRIRAPFQSLDEMHETMIENWNKVVKPGDKVYHLGDVTFQYHDKFQILMRSLNGSKNLVVGNHDRIWNPALKATFAKAVLWRGFNEYGFTCTHIPLRLDNLRDGKYNVHGHIHQNMMADPRYINVCVEQRNYTPVHLDTLLAEIKAKDALE